MAVNVLVGAQWGDEGKGKIIDFLTERAEMVVRFQGGANAGHTVEFGDKKFVLHLIPSGMLRDGKVCVIGNGVVVDPIELLDEIKGLEEKGIDEIKRLNQLSDNLVIKTFFEKNKESFRQILYGKEEDTVGIHAITYFISQMVPVLRDRPTVRPSRETSQLAGQKIVERRWSVSWLVPMCANKINKSQTLLGIDEFQIFDGVFVFTMAHVGGEHRQSILSGPSPLFDTI